MDGISFHKSSLALKVVHCFESTRWYIDKTLFNENFNIDSNIRSLKYRVEKKNREVEEEG